MRDDSRPQRQTSDVIEKEVVRDWIEEAGNGEDDQACLESLENQKKIAVLRQFREALARDPHYFEDSAKQQNKQRDARHAEINRVLQVDVMNLNPLRASDLIQRKNIHSQARADDRVPADKLRGSARVTPARLRRTGWIRLNASDCRDALHIRRREQRQ